MSVSRFAVIFCVVLIRKENRCRFWRIGEGIENLVRESIRQTAMGTYTALSSRHKTQILQLIEQALKQSAKLFIVTSVDTRRFLRKITEATLFGRTDFVMAGIRRGEPYTSGRKY
ncbi:secretion system apparatus protein SsaV [Salmonella enterica subsp. enterica]|uniref:Secretion system apparatus protein SsaV n=1 Tax=Salmonella enterica I TaxID=59201 RepID=A0A447U3Y9_SALET|nr:secretion system apparatus protein SsaV [Salmonella enterica subsp. enterica]